MQLPTPPDEAKDLAGFLRDFWPYAATGLAGAYVALVRSKENRTAMQKIAYLLAGMFVSMFGAPWIAEWFHVTSVRGMAGLFFGVGAAWNLVIDLAEQKLRDKFGARGTLEPPHDPS